VTVEKRVGQEVIAYRPRAFVAPELLYLASLADLEGFLPAIVGLVRVGAVCPDWLDRHDAITLDSV